jgi:Fe-S-cluster-containing dehydrogenase component
MDRRTFLKLFGLASGAAAASCGTKEPERLIPYLVPPDDGVLPGEARWVPATCTECPAGCGVLARVRDGRPVKLEGNGDHPVNKGGLCMRGQASLARLYHPDRIKTPLIKEGGTYKEISWDAALGKIKSALGNASTAKKNYFLSGRTTGAIVDVIDQFCARWKVTRLPEFEVYSHSNIRKANGYVFGMPRIPDYRIDKADFLLTIGADILETFVSPVRFARMIAESRENNPNFKWIHIEPHFSLTGANADTRFALKPGTETALLETLLSSAGRAEKTGLSGETLDKIAGLLASAPAPLIITGGVSTAHASGLKAAVQTAMIQKRTGMPGKTMDLGSAFNYDRVGSFRELKDFTGVLEQDGANVFFLSRTSAVDVYPPLGKALRSAALRVGVGDLMTDTMKSCDVILPLSHSLESWGEEVSMWGTTSVLQPAFQPLYNTLSPGDILLRLSEDPSTYQSLLAGRWRESGKDLIEKGFIQIPAGSLEGHEDSQAVQEALNAAPATLGGKAALVCTPSIRAYDGRSAELDLLKEIPDPLSTISWGKWFSISEADAMDLKVEDRDEIFLDTPNSTFKLPVKIQPGLPKGVVMIQRPHLQESLHIGEGDEIPAIFPVTRLKAAGSSLSIPILSGSMLAAGRGILPDDPVSREAHRKATFYPKHAHKDYRWALAVDLDRCTGCGACVGACYVENNIPLTGALEHARGREMSWLRVEPFFNEKGRLEFIPMMCQQCDNAPCEPVCPVIATYHNPEGLNVQVYNRCVGTRYCSNNCPYKARRFNWLDHPLPGAAGLMTNPDLSRRPKGVMEKCTFCIQRIRYSEDKAKDEKRKVRDGEVIPACAQSCPTGAIAFGNLLDPASSVAKLAASGRAYRMLEELGTEPAVYYLKTVRSSAFGVRSGGDGPVRSSEEGRHE